MNTTFMCCWCPGAMQAWREIRLWDTIDRTLRKNYNIDAIIFSLFDQLCSAQKNCLWRSFGVCESVGT